MSFWENNKEVEHESVSNEKQFIENRDYYFDNGLMVLTAHFLLKRGYCCGNICRHCPYQTAETTPL